MNPVASVPRVMRIAAVTLLLLALPALAGPKKVAPKKARPSLRPTSIVNVLKSRIIPELKMEKASLEQFVRYLRISTGLNIIVNKARIEKDGGDVDSIEVTLDLKNVTAATALKLALQGLELGFRIRGNVLIITSKKDALGKPVLRIYSVADLLVPIRDFPGPDMHIYPSNYEPPEPPEPEVQQNYEGSEELAELIRNFTGKDTWENEGVSIHVFRKHLVIRTYPEVHREIARFLAVLPR